MLATPRTQLAFLHVLCMCLMCDTPRSYESLATNHEAMPTLSLVAHSLKLFKEVASMFSQDPGASLCYRGLCLWTPADNNSVAVTAAYNHPLIPVGAPSFDKHSFFGPAGLQFYTSLNRR